MEPHEQRVIEERSELASKLVKLREFIRSNKVFQGLPLDEQARLKTQEFHMSMYWRVLCDRIENFPKQGA